MTAMGLSNQRQAALRDVEDDVFPLSVFQRVKDRIDLPQCKTNLSKAIVTLVKKAGKQQGSTRLGRASKNIASKILDEVAPAIDEQAFERRGFVILLNECQRLKAMFGKIPDGYKNQLVNVLENYDLISQSPKRKADYIRGLLLIGRYDLNDRHREVLDIFLKNDFDRDEVSFDQGINPVTMARFMQLINNLYYDQEEVIVSHQDVSEALGDALDWLVSEKERTGDNTLR